jgi:terminase small subunit-like protein
LSSAVAYNSRMKQNVGQRGAKIPAKPKRPVGRPTRYTPELAARICGVIATGSTLRAAAKACGVGWRTAARWNVERPEFRAAYEQARETRTLVWGEEIIEIADDLKGDYRQRRDGKTVQNKESVLRSKLRIEARQWVMARLDPRLWGDRQQIDVKADWMQLSEEERVRKAMNLLGMVREVVEREKQAKLEAAAGPRRITYDATDGDLLAEEEQRERERQRRLEEEGGEDGIGRDSARNPRQRWH